MDFKNNTTTKVSIRYMYDNNDAHEAEPTVLYDVANDKVIGKNTKPYLIGLSNLRNTAIKSEAGLSLFHSEAVEIDGTTHYYFTK